jgi:hypothetical protein
MVGVLPDTSGHRDEARRRWLRRDHNDRVQPCG